MVVPVILLVLLLLLLIVSYGVYRFVLYAPLGQQNDPFHLPNGPQYLPKYDEIYLLTKELVDLPCERVYITSQDGLQLAGDWHAGEPGHPVHICCHGYRGMGVRDFCGGAQTLLGRGDTVLLIHQRGQGDSQGHTMTFGIREREDVCFTPHMAWGGMETRQRCIREIGENIAAFLRGDRRNRVD